jgi:hypothetical protein
MCAFCGALEVTAALPTARFRRRCRFKIETDNYSVEYGWSIRAVINVTT